MADPDPFEGIPFLGDLARLLQQQGDQTWATASQLAMSVATDGTPEPNVDPLDRIKLEELARVAELAVAQVSGLTTSATGRALTVVPVTRGQWVQRSLPAYRSLLERVADSLSAAPPSEEDAEVGEPADVMGGLMAAMGPLLMGMTTGSMVGHLARSSFGQYDLPIPRPADDELMLVLTNVAPFGDEWGLPADDLLLLVCLHEIAHHAVLNVPHVRQRLTDLLEQYAEGFSPDPTVLEERLGGIGLESLGELDPTQGSAGSGLSEMFGDPEALLGAVRSDEQQALLPALQGLIAVVTGAADHYVDLAARSVLGDAARITEALRRRRVTEDQSTRFVQQLLGLQLTREQVDRGGAFVDGVVERAGTEGLADLWREDERLPTPAEVDAPGLWLERISYLDD